MPSQQTTFTLEFLQAINDWQIGSHKKSEKGATLERLTEFLPAQFRSCPLVCFRQLALEKGALWQLADELALPETVSAWTTSLKVAREIKGGVPANQEYQGVIFAIPPPAGSVVLNLQRLYRCPDFRNAIKVHTPSISRFGDGIGRYGDSQSEVVIKVSRIAFSDLCELGGFSSGRAELSRMYFDHEPSNAEMKEFDRLLSLAKIELGAEWIGGDSKERVLSRVRSRMPNLRSIKQLQDLASLSDD